MNVELNVNSHVVSHSLKHPRSMSLIGWKLFQEVHRLLAMNWKSKFITLR
jgi:hypothetical protein